MDSGTNIFPAIKGKQHSALNIKDCTFRQYTAASRFPDIHSKTKTGSRLHLPKGPQHKQREPVKLPLIDCSPGNSQSLPKVQS